MGEIISLVFRMNVIDRRILVLGAVVIIIGIIISAYAILHHILSSDVSGMDGPQKEVENYGAPDAAETTDNHTLRLHQQVHPSSSRITIGIDGDRVIVGIVRMPPKVVAGEQIQTTVIRIETGLSWAFGDSINVVSSLGREILLHDFVRKILKEPGVDSRISGADRLVAVGLASSWPEDAHPSSQLDLAERRALALAGELNLAFNFQSIDGKISHCSIGYDTVVAPKNSKEEVVGRSLLFIAIVGKHAPNDVRKLVVDELQDGESWIGLPVAQYSLFPDKVICSTE